MPSYSSRVLDIVDELESIRGLGLGSRVGVRVRIRVRVRVRVMGFRFMNRVLELGLGSAS